MFDWEFFKMPAAEILRRAKKIERVIETAGSPSVWILLEPVFKQPMIGTRVRDFLLTNKIDTVFQLMQADADHLTMYSPNFGYKCRKAISKELLKIGLHFRGTPYDD
jgi:hypothetical protein